VQHFDGAAFEHCRAAYGAQSADIELLRVANNQINGILPNQLGLAAFTAIDFCHGAWVFALGLSGAQKCCEGTAVDALRLLTVNGFESRVQPSMHRVGVQPVQIGNLLHRVATTALYQARVVGALLFHECPSDQFGSEASATMRALMSSARHAVMRSPNFTGFG